MPASLRRYMPAAPGVLRPLPPSRPGAHAKRSRYRSRMPSLPRTLSREFAGPAHRFRVTTVDGVTLSGTRTVDVHIRRLRAKLGPEHEHLIETVRGVGYRAADLPPER